jgi:16S rRNA (guanine966-N2)-methyltransferase
MRIVGGSHRGRPLQAPPGDRIRPTSDRAREALFNILAHRGWGPGGGPAYAGVTVLDAFAGTGALGLEALSRGAVRTIFLENDRTALATLRANVRALGEEARTATVPGDAAKPPAATARCALAFLDPPYGKGLAAPALEALSAAGWLEPGAVCVVETATAEALGAPPGFTLLDERRYGAARLTFLRAPGLPAPG